MSARAVSRQPHLSWPTPRECEPPAGADRYIWLVGKQSTISNRNTSQLTSLLGERWSYVSVFHRVCSLGRPQRLDLHLGSPLGAGQIGTRVLWFREVGARLQKSALPITCLVVMICLHGQRSLSLTGGSSRRKISPPRGRSKRTALSKSPNGPVAGLSPECGELGLTVCKSRSTASNLRTQGWSDSRPNSATHILQFRSIKP
jgi:hypothetical protein